jgi:hypothetical protein
MNVTAGAYALDDLLPEIAALAEVQGMKLARLLGNSLLRQVAFGDVDAVDGNAFGDAEGVERGGSCGFRSGSYQRVPELRRGVFRAAECVVLCERAVFTPNNKAEAVGFHLDLRQRLGERTHSDFFKDFCGFRPGEANRSNAFDRRQLNVIHDDEAIEMREEPAVLISGNFDFQFVMAAPRHQIALDAALRVEHKIPCAAICRQIVDGVGNHATEPAEAVFSAHLDAAQPTEVMHRRGESKCSDFGLGRVQLGIGDGTTERRALTRDAASGKLPSERSFGKRSDKCCFRHTLGGFLRRGSDFSKPYATKSQQLIIALIQMRGLRTRRRENGMTRGFGARLWNRSWMAAAIFALGVGLCSGMGVGQQAPAGQSEGQSPSGQSSPGKSAQKPNSAQGETRITPEEAKKLFAMVDQLLKFSSDETGLQVKSTVGRKLTSRAEVESYLKEKFDEDEGAKRLQRGEIVLKKFGLLDHDFDMKPFLLALLTEQIEAYYDSKTKTVYLLDWMHPDDQESVLAHELTHALQDQRVDLEKWNDQTPNDVSTNAHEDIEHLAKDEIDTAREAVAEGQATAVMVDDELKPHGRSLLKDPEVVEFLKQQMADPESSPVMARAPLLLSESLLFPYREGLSFEQDIWMDRGREAAFAGALDKPPTSTWEIINPLEFEKSHVPMVPLLPNIHPLLDGAYKPYDIGQVGQLDLHILTQLFGGDEATKNLTPAWDGGIYWAGQLKSAKTPQEQASTKSIALFYLSAWKNEQSAEAFAQLYANSLARKYSGVKKDASASTPSDAPTGTDEVVYNTNEGPVVITTRGKLVFVAESFDLPVARKLTSLILDSQGTGEMRMAQDAQPAGVPGAGPAAQPVSGSTLSGGLVHLFAESGAMKSAVDAAKKAAQMTQ